MGPAFNLLSGFSVTETQVIKHQMRHGLHTTLATAGDRGGRDQKMVTFHPLNTALAVPSFCEWVTTAWGSSAHVLHFKLSSRTWHQAHRTCVLSHVVLLLSPYDCRSPDKKMGAEGAEPLSQVL